VSTRDKRFARTKNGTRIYYEVGGREDALPLVLIRGLARSSSYWLEVRDFFERERRVLVLDNRGAGRSDCPRPPWSTADMADDVASVLIDSRIERADVLGISLGGMIAQHVALRHPHRVRKLILGCTTPGGRRARSTPPMSALALVRSMLMPFDEGVRYSAPYVLSADALSQRPEIVDVWLAIAASEPRSRIGVIAQLVAAATHDVYALLDFIEHPTLVITGDADRLIAPANSRLLAERIPRATLHTLAGAGHDFPTERPEETAHVVLDFLEGPAQK
jgi:pimeloyl-ACP methyl ester carboxylesterase